MEMILTLWKEAYQKMPNNVRVKEFLMSTYFDADKAKYNQEIIELGMEIYNRQTTYFVTTDTRSFFAPQYNPSKENPLRILFTLYEVILRGMTIHIYVSTVPLIIHRYTISL